MTLLCLRAISHEINLHRPQKIICHFKQVENDFELRQSARHPVTGTI